MRFAAFVVVMFFSEVHSQQQCSDSLGTCSGSRASLMQVKSLSQKLQASSVQGTSNRAQTLAGFQKYTQELVDKYMADPPADAGSAVDRHSSQSEEVMQAIGIIKEYLEQLYTDLLVYHNQDKAAAKYCAEVPARCDEAHFNSSVVTAIETIETHVIQKKSLHATCRDELAAVCAEPACPDYHEYRKTDDAALLPYCAKGGHLAHQAAGLGTEELSHFESCLQPTKQWLDPLYDKYTNCRDHAENEETASGTCSTEQGEFEAANCHMTTWTEIHCENHENCLEHGRTQCEGSLGASGDCVQIEQNWRARQADNETAMRILCLLNVLTNIDDNAAQALQACHGDESTYAEENMFWEVPCEVKVLESTPEKCQAGVKTTDQCNDLWLIQNYPDLASRPAGSDNDCYNAGKNAGMYFGTCEGCGSNVQLDFNHEHVVNPYQ